MGDLGAQRAAPHKGAVLLRLCVHPAVRCGAPLARCPPAPHLALQLCQLGVDVGVNEVCNVVAVQDLGHDVVPWGGGRGGGGPAVRPGSGPRRARLCAQTCSRCESLLRQCGHWQPADRTGTAAAWGGEGDAVPNNKSHLPAASCLPRSGASPALALPHPITPVTAPRPLGPCAPPPLTATPGPSGCRPCAGLHCTRPPRPPPPARRARCAASRPRRAARAPRRRPAG